SPNRLAILSRGQNRRLIDQIFEIGAGKARGLPRQTLDRDILLQRLTAHVDVENGDAALNVGASQDHLALEAPRPQERRVERVGPVRSRDDDDICRGIETVHFDQDLVEGLFALVVTTSQAGTPLASYRVDFVDKDDAWGVALGLLEQIAHATGADPNEHLD